MLLINNLSFSRNGIKIFENLNFSINKGEIILIKGKNGSGKTTLIKTILNILEPDNGEIFWEGKNIKKNIFNFYNEATFIMDKTTSTKHLTVLDNLNFWKGLSSSKLTYDKVLLLLKDQDSAKKMGELNLKIANEKADWDKNYLSEEHMNSFIDFYSTKDIEFCFMQEFLK